MARRYYLVRETGMAGGWLGITDAIKKVIRPINIAVKKLAAPIVKILPKPIRKIVSIPGKTFDHAKEVTQKVLAKVDDNVRGAIKDVGKAVTGKSDKKDAPPPPPPATTEVVEVPEELPVYEEPLPPPEEDHTVRNAVIAGTAIVAVGVITFILYKRSQRK